MIHAKVEENARITNLKNPDLDLIRSIPCSSVDTFLDHDPFLDFVKKKKNTQDPFLD